MAKDYVNKFDKTSIAVQDGDITKIPANALVTAINSGGMWFGGIDGAIQRAAGNLYHAQAQQAMPLYDLQTIVAKGNRTNHQGFFDNVVFVVDDLKSPLDSVLYKGLEASHNEAYKNILIPTIRMGVMAGVRESPEEAVQKMGEGLKRFMDDYAHKTRLEDITFVVYNDAQTQKRLTDGLISLR